MARATNSGDGQSGPHVLRPGSAPDEIMERLNVSQSTVSRLLKRAEAEGIVRITVTAPAGTHPDLEEGLQAAYGLGKRS